MKLCFSTLACPEWSLDKIIEQASACGVQGIDFRGIGKELDITQLPEFTTGLGDTLVRFKQKKLAMPCLNTSITLVTFDAVKWQTMLEEAQRHAALARKTSTPFLRIFGGSYSETISRDEACNLAKRHLRQLTKICADHGCHPVLETHDSWRTSSEVLEIIGDFDPKDAGVLWDLEHPYNRGEALADTAENLRKWIQHIHIKDTKLIDGKPAPALLGEGRLPLKDSIAVLKSIGYDGWICLETEKRWYPDTAPEPEISLPQFVQFMKPLIA